VDFQQPPDREGQQRANSGAESSQACWPAAHKVAIIRKLTADNQFVSIQQLGDLSLIVSGIHKGVDLKSIHLTERFIVHWQLRLAGQEALNAKHSQSPSL